MGHEPGKDMTHLSTVETVDEQNAPAIYRQALQSAVMLDEGHAGRIWMRGRDRAELLQRLTTNDVVRLKPGQGMLTVLTTPIGRIIDVLAVYALEDALLIVTSIGQGPAVYGHLRKNIFFNDQVTLEAAGRSHGQLALFGPQAASVLETLSGADLAGLPLHGSVETTIAGAPVRIARRKPIGGQGFTLFVPIKQLDAVRAALAQAGIGTLDDETYHILRVEHGLPAFGHELGLEYIPLETGLSDAICFSKGCYVGQEIIARMESRNRLAKQLRGLRLSGAASAPGKLQVDGKESGDLTSAVLSPRFGPIALAYVRSAHAATGSVVGLENGVSGTVVDLPFEPDGA